MTDSTPAQSFAPRQGRRVRLGQHPAIAWLTGLPGAGKSSVAAEVDRVLGVSGRHCTLLDGDALRRGLNGDLGYTEADRAENVRRSAEAARLMAEAGLIVIVALISPLRRHREAARRIAGDIPFLEVFVDTPLSVCEARDPKGLYALARAGRIAAFTGVSAPYEPPPAPDLTLSTEGRTVAAAAAPLGDALLRLSRLDA